MRHEAAHGLAHVRGVCDTSRQGRYHNARYRENLTESLRATLVLGATAYLRHVRSGRIAATPWLAGMLARKPPKLVAVALANKTARIAWKLMTSGERYDPQHRLAREGLGASQYGGLRAKPLAPPIDRDAA